MRELPAPRPSAAEISQMSLVRARAKFWRAQGCEETAKQLDGMYRRWAAQWESPAERIQAVGRDPKAPEIITRSDR